MRPILLEIDGINSFFERQTVDFERAGADNIFVISGETGSGKTTILDCILLSLYQNNGDRGRLEDFINLKRTEASVRFVFELDGGLYRMHRVLSRKAGKNRALLSDGRTDAALAEGTAAFALLQDRIGLTREEFTKVVVLQQGEFAEFLSAGKAKRNEIIGSLFKLHRFRRVAGRFSDAVRDKRAKIDACDKALEPYLLTDAESLAALAAALDGAEAGEKAAEANRRRAFGLFEAAAAADRLYREQEALTREIAEYRKRMGEKRAALEAAEAERTRLAAAGARIAADAPLRESLQKQVVMLEEAVKAAAETSRKTAEIKRLFADYEKKAGEAAAHRGRERTALGEAETLRAQIAALAAEAARQGLVLPADMGEAEAAALAADIRARAREREIRQNAAAVLAAELVEGAPCPVCGRTAAHTHRSDERAEAGQAEAGRAEAGRAEAGQAETAAPAIGADFARQAEVADALLRAYKAVKGPEAGAKDAGFLAAQADLAAGQLKREGERLKAEIRAARQRLKETAGAGEPDALLAAARARLSALEAERAGHERAAAQNAAALAGLGGVLAGLNAALTQAEQKQRPVSGYAPGGLDAARAAHTAAQAEAERRAGEAAALRVRVEAERTGLARKTALCAERKGHETGLDRLERIHKLLKGSAFVEYVSAEYIRDFTLAASERMRALSGGKYTLLYDEASGDFLVRDFLADNEARPVKTLSGGETFLASLSMAIAISAEIAASLDFDFFFIDEGFGTLDENAIETVVQALYALSKDTLVG
ncbi:MAG: SMC family ATPase, partial [Clostridiales bacterium]|nr:SMC family ATPase [Clostridiales bacterium]